MRWHEMSRKRRAVLLTLASAEIALTATAAADLWARPQREVRGPKVAWWPFIFVQPVGAPCYLLWGRRSGGRGAFLRRLYRGGRPNRLARAMNRCWAVVQGSGLLLPSRLVTLEVPSRTSGRVLSLPLVLADHDGKRYAVSMLGPDAGWVHNVRAAGGRVTLRHGRREAVRLVEVDPAERAPVIRRYLAVAPGGRPHIPVDRRAPLSEFERIAASLPVFRVEDLPSGAT
ncbi:hypothetical protein [Spongiactinospora sp. TRM90649]|uniref:hypothetical protein n=1 Tax=Spongiactinospora sp. TRM90649 TaxID=3031114 RepID=UPI0023F87139|nr:hypothetical protein [Spongiactinospora sp. TRM90649]MDF5755213.1 hypothetical protein [Spongiactinospora sp. TRM90649]